MAGRLAPVRVALAQINARVGDAEKLAGNLGVQLLELPIGTAMDTFDAILEPVFEGREPDITEENLQARIRGNLLMALSNKFGWIVLTAGNKSENAVGYKHRQAPPGIKITPRAFGRDGRMPITNLYRG